MAIRIGDECAERIEPLKATGIFTRQTPGVSQENSRTCPRVRRIILNRRQAQHGNTAPDAHTSSELHKHVTSVSESAELRTITARR